MKREKNVELYAGIGREGLAQAPAKEVYILTENPQVKAFLGLCSVNVEF